MCCAIKAWGWVLCILECVKSYPYNVVKKVYCCHGMFSFDLHPIHSSIDRSTEFRIISRFSARLNDFYWIAFYHHHHHSAIYLVNSILQVAKIKLNPTNNHGVSFIQFPYGNFIYLLCRLHTNSLVFLLFFTFLELHQFGSVDGFRQTTI